MNGTPDSSLFDKDSTYADEVVEVATSMGFKSRDRALTATSSRRTAGAFAVRRNRVRDGVSLRVRVTVRVEVGVGVNAFVSRESTPLTLCIAATSSLCR